MPRYLTKSRFKLAHECETKLFYSNKKTEYADKSLEDSFLKSLAEGGFQVGELAKYYFCENPIEEQITVKTLDYEEALRLTNEKIENGNKVLAEAAFRHENLFIRADIIRIDTQTKEIELHEVKAKSYSSTDDFMSVDKKTGELKGIKSGWESYLFDVAFQKYVLRKCFPDYSIKSFLMMANKDSVATVNGLNQFFKIDKNGDRISIDVETGLTRNELGDKILISVNVDEEVRWIWNNPIETDLQEGISFADYVNLLSNAYQHDEKLIVPIHKDCKKCQFRTTIAEDEEGKLKNGFRECWLHATGLSETELQKPLVTDLWSFGFRGMQKLIESGVYLLEYVTEELITSKKESKTVYPGLSPLERRVLQVEKSKNGDSEVFLDKKGLKREMKCWSYPLHFIDFETSRVAIPFHEGRKPYEQIAFQFSHHVVSEDYTIEHRGQYISFEPGYFPNYDFLRALKNELEHDNGTIFRYHNHENTVLCEIYEQLENDKHEITDKTELQEFIQSITHKKNVWEGDRDMVDLYKLVTSYYYPPAAGGSNSIKAILPATIMSSDFLREKYSKSVYGTSEMPSLNFLDKIWLPDEEHLNPYKQLPPVFEEWSDEQLDSLVESVEEIADGGAALTAYAKMQFSHVPANQREMLRNALLKYCELDTLAMVMIWEYWVQELN
ncbi:MAG: DUF2779 domain-containing protein [Paludibacter sp.]